MITINKIKNKKFLKKNEEKNQYCSIDIMTYL